MKNAVIALMMLVAMEANAAIPAPVNNDIWTLTIDNTDDLVSPGGYVHYTVVGSSTNNTAKYTALKGPSITTDGVSASSYSPYMNWQTDVSRTHPRHGRIKIKDNITEITLPRTLTLRLSYGNKTSSDTFTLKADGKHGHYAPGHTPTDRYYVDLYTNLDGSDSYRWNEFICLNNEGNCPVNIKNQDLNKYMHGGVSQEYTHTCTDNGWPASSVVQQRVPLVFDLEAMAVPPKGKHVPQPGRISHPAVRCRISSPSLFLIRPVPEYYIANER